MAVTSNENEFILIFLESHKFWAFENKIRVPKEKLSMRIKAKMSLLLIAFSNTRKLECLG
jgi:hypothetical protein